MNIARFGPETDTEGTTFRLWAPLVDRVLLKIEGQKTLPMLAQGHGWYSLKVPDAAAGCRYRFVLPDGLEVPDPASRFQPSDVHGPSEVVDPEFCWKTERWQGRAWEEMVIYELHIGAFTQGGTFLAAIDHLDHLAKLGVTALQLMPLSDFPGGWNWGYDGVLPYAPDSSYGRPQDLKRLVDEAHRRGICVFLDVVYNHFGPDGNYLPAYAPVFTDRHRTPWGDGVNYDGRDSGCIREFIVQNAIYWIEEFRLDGLRLDAVHAIDDDRDRHILHELADRVKRVAAGRHVHLIVENEDNDAALLERDETGSPLRFTAQWNDDIHHVLHIASTDETFGYYADYADDPGKLGRALAEGFVFQGEHMPYRGGRRGTPSGHLAPTAFISFIQNHDQIGNRVLGDRVLATCSRERLKALSAIYLLAPQIPMLFMGEEWGATEPFPYFCDLNDELNEKVRQGRRKELAKLPGFDCDVAPDPAAIGTFQSAKLNWEAAAANADLLDHYRRMLSLRHARIVPLPSQPNMRCGTYRVEGPSISVEWTLGRATLRLDANLSNNVMDREIEAGHDICRIGTFDNGRFGPWSLIWSLTGEGV